MFEKYIFICILLKHKSTYLKTYKGCATAKLPSISDVKMAVTTLQMQPTNQNAELVPNSLCTTEQTSHFGKNDL